MFRACVLTLAVVLLATPLGAQNRNAPANPLQSIRAFRCSFPTFGVGRWEGMAATVIAGEDTFSFEINNINLRRGAARVVASATVEVTARLTETGLNMIEQTPGGNFILTTIFTGGASADKFHAVHSRHLGDLTTPPSASQFYGTCEVAD